MKSGADYDALIIASLTSGVIALDGAGCIVRANAAAAKQLGICEERLAAGNLLEAAADIQPFVKVVRHAISERQAVSRREITLPCSEGGARVIGLTVSLIEGPGGFEGAILLFADLSEVRDLERAVALNSQLARIGEMTAGVVHELRNPLTVIRGSAELLLRGLDGGDKRRAALRHILDETVLLERTIHRFLSLAKPFSLNVGRCDPHKIAERACRLCAQRAKDKHAVLLCESGPPLAAIAADFEKTAQALANIVDNAIDAVGESGGEVRVRAFQEGDLAVFEVCDNGPGIRLPPGKDLFAPFFSMKENGTGLGLSIVQQIVSAHKGTVACANREEGGARFVIRLPVNP